MDVWSAAVFCTCNLQMCSAPVVRTSEYKLATLRQLCSALTFWGVDHLGVYVFTVVVFRHAILMWFRIL